MSKFKNNISVVFVALVGALIFLGAVAARAQSSLPLEILKMEKRRAQGWGWADNGWYLECPLVHIEAVMNGEMKDRKLAAKLYLFDANDHLLRRIEAPYRCQADGEEYVDMPKTFSVGESFDLYFPIAPDLAKGKGRWQSAVVTLGNNEYRTAKVYPDSRSVEDFNLKQQPAFITGGEQGAPASKDGVNKDEKGRFLVNHIKKTRYSGAVWQENRWQHGATVYEARIEIEKMPSNSRIFARAYFYNSAGKLIHSHQRPPQVEVEPGRYQSLPKTYEVGKEYSVYFPIPDKFARGHDKVKTALIVFGNKRSASVCTMPASADWKDFPFKEKQSVEEDVQQSNF